MATSNLPTFLSLLFFISTCFHISASQTDVVVSSICPMTRNPPFCATVVRSAATTNLKVLAGFTLNLAHTLARDSHRLARSLAASTSNPLLKQRFSSCSTRFGGAFAQLGQAQKHLAGGGYQHVTNLTTGAMASVNKCLTHFKPGDASTLTKNGNTLKDLCSIVLVLADILPGARTDDIGN